MAEAIVSDWIAEFNSLEPEELRTFSALHAENHELSTAIHTILNDRTKHLEVSKKKLQAIKKVLTEISRHNIFSCCTRSALNSTTSIVRARTS